MGKKRGHGTGSVVQLPDGRWQGRVSYWDAGHLRRKAVYGRTRAEVERKLRTLLTNLEQGILPSPERLTLRQYLEDWLGAQGARLRPSTARQYAQTIRNHICPALGHERLASLTATRIERFLSSLLEQGYSANTVRLARCVLRRALADAVRDGLCARNAAALARPVRIDPPRVTVWSVEEAARFLEVAEEHWLGPLFCFLIGTGVRVSEALGLSWEYVDFDGGSITIVQQLQRVGKQWTLVPPKSRQSRRRLPLSSLVYTALLRQRAQQELWRAEPQWKGNPWRLVFTTHCGSPLDPRNVRHHFRRLAERANLPACRVHDLRHLCGTLALLGGADLKTVSALLGHSQISVTANFYLHVQDSLVRDAVSRVEQLLRQVDANLDANLGETLQDKAGHKSTSRGVRTHQRSSW